MPSVLIIDADEDFAGRLKSTLEAHGADVQVTGDGRAGLDMARINIPDAIIVCVELPRMSGYSICAKLKKDASLKAVTLVITSAEATQETFEHHKKLKNRAEEYLRKPFEPKVLVDILRPYVELDAGSEDIAISDDLSLSPHDEVSIEDTESFSEDDFHFDDVPPLHSESVAVSAQEPGETHPDHPEYEEDDAEAMTTIGVVPSPANDLLFKEIEQLRAELEAEREAHAQSVRDRDEAIANERAAVQQLQTLSAGSASSVAASRDLLAIKKELNDRDKQLLELRDAVQEKERQLLDQRDSEMEVEGRIVQVQEDLERVQNEKAAVEGQLAEAQRRADEANSLQDQLTEANARIGELQESLERSASEIDDHKKAITAHEDEINSLRSTNQTLNGEVTRLGNELSAVSAESAELREQLQAAQSQSNQLDIDLQDTRLKADSARNALEATQASLVETEEQAARAFERIRRDGEVKMKVRQALDIALRLLNEPEEDGSVVQDGQPSLEEVHP